MGALGAGLALPFSLALAAAPVGAELGLPAHVATTTVGSDGSAALTRWRDYALASITPQFSWALRPAALEAPRVLDNYSGRVAHAQLLDLQAVAAANLSVSVATSAVSDTPGTLPDHGARVTRVPQSGLQRTVVTPTLTHDFGDQGKLQLIGVLAYQRFASLGLGTASSNWAPRPVWAVGSSYGAGARIEFGEALGENWHWKVGYQSRVAMSPFANYRGVFAEPGRFDIPASASAELSYAFTPGLSFGIGVQRVMYSDVTPFTSSNLPRRFLALLGDSTSPAFAWQDLDVYSAGWTWRSRQAGVFDLRYTTRQQPLPTSQLLERALADGIADSMLEFGWSRDFSANTSVGMAARYASSPYYLMQPTWQTNYGSMAGRFEFEALWTTRF